VDPTVQVGTCGVGVGVLGSGTSSDCGGSQTSTGSTADDGSLLGVNPSVQADLCGLGAGVLGTGTSSDCATNQSSTGAASSGLLGGVLPNVQVGLCGTGVGVLGTGTSSTCADSSSTGTDPGGNGGGGSGGGGTTVGSTGGGGGGGGFDAIEAVATPTAALGLLVGANTLPFTGADTLATATAGLVLAGLGAGLLQLRKVRSLR
jgi:hypothetical protein